MRKAFYPAAVAAEQKYIPDADHYTEYSVVVDALDECDEADGVSVLARGLEAPVTIDNLNSRQASVHDKQT